MRFRRVHKPISHRDGVRRAFTGKGGLDRAWSDLSLPPSLVAFGFWNAGHNHFPPVPDRHDYTRDPRNRRIVTRQPVLNRTEARCVVAFAASRKASSGGGASSPGRGRVERDSPGSNKYCFVAVAKIDFPSSPFPSLRLRRFTQSLSRKWFAASPRDNLNCWIREWAFFRKLPPATVCECVCVCVCGLCWHSLIGNCCLSSSGQQTRDEFRYIFFGTCQELG